MAVPQLWRISSIAAAHNEEIEGNQTAIPQVFHNACKLFISWRLAAIINPQIVSED